MFASFIDWLCGSIGGYGFDPVTHDYTPITYVVGVFMLIVGLPFWILLIFSRANALYEALQAPFVRTVRGGLDPFEDPFESRTGHNDHHGS